MKEIWKLIPKFFRRMNTPYHITVINEETMAESMQLPLTKKSLFLFLSSLLVGIFVLLSAIIFFTPLKYYLPGYNIDNNRKQILLLQKSTDSLFRLNAKREAYIINLVNVVKGDVPILDTTKLSQASIKALQIKEQASIKSANELRKTIPPSAKKDSIKSAVDSIIKNKKGK
jgi:hypothetical protein